MSLLSHVIEACIKKLFYLLYLQTIRIIERSFEINTHTKSVFTSNEARACIEENNHLIRATVAIRCDFSSYVHKHINQLKEIQSHIHCLSSFIKNINCLFQRMKLFFSSYDFKTS